ncbi:MAG: tyrosine-type recombinase/integrase, partial [Clostridiales bacterium]|nr:tyrosine-type recombinase/integrase [Clostridiales bacterium]
MAKREEYLAKHTYAIWKGKNGRWYTYLPDNEKGRILVGKSTKRDIEDAVIHYWKAEAENPTIREVFEEWNDRRLQLKKISNATHLRNEQIFKRYYAEFGKRRIKEVSPNDLDDFLEAQIPKFHMTAKAFSNLKTVTRGFLKRAKKRKLIEYNVEELFQEMDVSESYFTISCKEDCEEVFNEEEMSLMMTYLEENLDLNNLAILLMFLTGIRVGEAVALKHSDFRENTFQIRRTETRYRGSDGNYIYAVKEFPKTQAGVRTVVIPMDYSWITDVIRYTNPDEEYIFVKNGKRMTTHAVRMRQGRLCTKLGIYP